MIEVINRELLIPREEFNLGTNYDDTSEIRQFHLKRITSGGVDLGNLTFALDMKYFDGTTDVATFTKEVTPRDIILTLVVLNSMLQVPGTVLVQIRALSADGTVKWSSYEGAFFVEDAINVPASYTGDLSELERLEAEWNAAKDAEAARVLAENARVEAEEGRAEAETGRVEAEEARALAEEERVEADGRREQEFADAISTAEETLNADYRDALDDAKDELTNAVQEIADDAASSASAAASSAHDAHESAAAAALSEQNAAASEGILEFYTNYVVPRFVIANNRLYIRDTATQSFIVANNRLYIQNPA
jgi:hypothetical protein